MPVSAADRELVLDLRERLAPHGDLRELRLFGPRSRGDHRADMDLCLIFTAVDATLRATVDELVWQVGFDHGVTLCPLLCTVAEFADHAAPPLLARIRNEGLCP